MSPTDAYTQLIHFLDQGGARYRLIDHAPEGRAEIVSPMRGNNLSQAARLDRSMALKSQDYAALVKPRVERIATFDS